MTTDHDDFPADETYRSLSATAVLSLVLGLLSPGLFLWPLLVVLPCLAIVTAFAALRRIAADESAGRGLALVGLGLGVMCLASWGGYKLAYNGRLHAQAAPTAQLILELLGEGDNQNAFLLTKNAKDRGAVADYFRQPTATRQADDDHEGHDHEGHDHEGHDHDDSEGSHPPGAAPSTPEADLADLLLRPEIKLLVESRPFESVRKVANGSIFYPGANRVALTQTYEVRPAKGPTRRFLITLDRTSAGSGPPVWRVIGVTLDES